jgi:carbamoyl-phosphate synthase large subunit
VLILGGGPNRIGQGIEFDYCCCHASYSLRKAGFETIMMNCNPETVSTDYDTSSRLYFEPVTLEDVLNVIDAEKPEGIIVQFGGQTPLKLATALHKELTENPILAASGKGNVRIWGTSPDSIDIAEDRDRWMELLTKLNIRQPAGGSARTNEQAIAKAHALGYPCMIRPSYVLGGRSMEIIYNDAELTRYLTQTVVVDNENPVLVDKYLDRATELDVDALCDVEGNVTICGVMEHIEQAGIHSGDSACSIPTQTLSEQVNKTVREWTKQIAKELKVVGLINIQFAVQDDVAYIIEANPRASRTVPFVAKAVGHPIAKYASLLMSGQTLKDIKFLEEPLPTQHVAVKEVVLPFNKFPGCDTLLGPEMRSTGEVMGIDKDFASAYAKAAIAAGMKLPSTGKVFITISDKHKKDIIPIARDLGNLGFGLVSTTGTAKVLREAGVPCEIVLKIHEGRPNPMDIMKNGEICLMMLTSSGDEYDLRDGKDLRRLALSLGIPTVTTVAGARATTMALQAMRRGPLVQVPIQDYFPNYYDDSIQLIMQ